MVIDSPEEQARPASAGFSFPTRPLTVWFAALLQEFIASNLKEYNDDVHGYWVGLSNNNANSSWTWIDGSNGTVE